MLTTARDAFTVWFLSLSLIDVDSWYTVMYRQAPRDLEDETWCTTRIATAPLQVSRFRLQCLRCWPTSIILRMSCKSLASFSFNSMHSQMYITWGCLSHMSQPDATSTLLQRANLLKWVDGFHISSHGVLREHTCLQCRMGSLRGKAWDIKNTRKIHATHCHTHKHRTYRTRSFGALADCQ